MNREAELETYPFKCKTKTIKYPGIHISPNFKDLFKLNHVPLLQDTQNSLQRWNNLPISLNGRISSVKMNILPKINYLFAMIPVTPPSDWFSSLNSTISKFYWKKKKSSIKWSTLQRPKKFRGHGAPNLYLYFISQKLIYIYHWIHNSNLPWLNIENYLVQSLDIKLLPLIDKSIKTLRGYKNNKTINTTMNAT